MFYGKQFNDEVQKNLSKSGSIASGKIGDLAVPKVRKFGNDYEMYLGYDKDNPASVYYKFVNKGVRGVGGVNARPKGFHQIRLMLIKLHFQIRKWRTLFYNGTN